MLNTTTTSSNSSSSNDGGSSDTQKWWTNRRVRREGHDRLALSRVAISPYTYARSRARSFARFAHARVSAASLSLLVLSLLLSGITIRAFVTSARPTSPRGQSQSQTPSRSTETTGTRRRRWLCCEDEEARARKRGVKDFFLVGSSGVEPHIRSRQSRSSRVFSSFSEYRIGIGAKSLRIPHQLPIYIKIEFRISIRNSKISDTLIP